MKSKMFFKIVFSFLLVFTFVVKAQATGITISPPKFEFSVDPGKSVQGMIRIINNDEKRLVLDSDVQDFIAGNETGTPQFVNPTENDTSISLGKWISVGSGEIIVPAKGELEVEFTINVPVDAEPGGHYGSIFFFPPTSEGQVAIVQKIGSLVLVRVTGEAKEVGHLETFGNYLLKSQESFEGSQEVNFYEKFPVPFVVRYQNEGNIHIKPQGKIEITNTFGKKLTKIGVKTILNENGLQTGEEIVDYIPINDRQGNVLAKSIRMFTADYQGEAYWFQKEDGTKEIRFKGYPIGRYKAVLSLKGVDGKEEVSETTFIIFPWKQIVEYGGGGIILLILLIKIGKWNRRRMKERLKAELKAEMGKSGQ